MAAKSITRENRVLKQTYRLPEALVQRLKRSARRERRAVNAQVEVLLERGLESAR